MATYKQIQEYIKKNYGFSCKSCWIAHVKSEYKLTKRIAFNRLNADERVYPCPEEKRKFIVEAFRHFEMI